MLVADGNGHETCDHTGSLLLHMVCALLKSNVEVRPKNNIKAALRLKRLAFPAVQLLIAGSRIYAEKA